MRTKNFTLLFFSLILCPLAVFSQSLSGNVNAKATAAKLGYANVDIYKNDKLVANVLTDAGGNFSVKLDTGTYRCEINYAGYEKVTKVIKVTKDETADFGMTVDKSSKYSADSLVVVSSHERMGVSSTATYDIAEKDVALEEVEVVHERKPAAYKRSAEKHADVRVFGDADAAPSYEYAPAPPAADGFMFTSVSGGTSAIGADATSAWGKSLKTDSAAAGKLTAGEINDFSKWKLWTDLNKGELNSFQSTWNFSPSGRYVVQLTDQNGLPLANAKAELMNGDKKLYLARTDNTGKAELWEKLDYDTISKMMATSIRITYNGNTKTISPVKKFENGINTLVLNTPCAQSPNVDVAIVVDATGSMQDEINYLKSDLNDVVYKSKGFSNTLNLRFANVFYRDQGQGDAYVTQKQDFTRILSESVAYTNAHNADGGGDTPEAVEIALDVAINQLSWSDDTRTKILLLVLDAPPHNTPEICEKMKKLSMQAAEKGIRIVPVAGSGADKGTEYLMRCLALATNGTYVFLDDHSGIGNPHIKPSTDNYQSEILNDLLVRVIKAFTYMPTCEKQIADLGVNLPSSLVVVPVDTTAKDTAAASLTTAAMTTGVTPPKDTLDLQWKFYPNPTSGIVNIESNKNIEELYISDLSGKVLQIIKDIEPAKTVTVDLSIYPTGIYLIRYPMGKQWMSGKIILSR